ESYYEPVGPFFFYVETLTSTGPSNYGLTPTQPCVQSGVFKFGSVSAAGSKYARAVSRCPVWSALRPACTCCPTINPEQPATLSADMRQINVEEVFGIIGAGLQSG
ncbi:MAG TPA: hypothetical protein VFY96_09660, partial [Candidatus Binatia bacterium]|nr:hypothetical protein [Candidatus Binatia bacterium]